MTRTISKRTRFLSAGAFTQEEINRSRNGGW